MKTLLLALFVVSAIRAQTPDPTTQMLNTLNTASLQLQALGTLTLNNNTFVQLVQVLNTVFGSMRTSVVPFYYTQMQSINTMNMGLANRIFQVSSNINAVFTALVGYVDSMSSNYAGQLATIGDTLNNFQFASLANLDYLESTLGQFSAQLSELNSNLTQTSQAARNVSQQAASALSQGQVLLQQTPGLVNPHNKSVDNIDISLVTLGSTTLAYCKSFVYNFPNTYGGNTPNPPVPNVGININLNGPETTANSNYDAILASTNPTSATIWICDRSLSTFTLRPATLFISVWL